MPLGIWEPSQASFAAGAVGTMILSRLTQVEDSGRMVGPTRTDSILAPIGGEPLKGRGPGRPRRSLRFAFP